ncbi:alkaline phosphatase family protein [Rubripirellula reticaptiva]|uniref:Cofactor-independent phosphoglycerate mutase n=1 Tax=Rubripirellula reticaptiva TaxID=2528013 RepID=A0A5C6F6G7_9BACT|nr:alkaline phosphatase family protein [Rubripirellula reticaptiva]TWU55091.1 cofactor-independent phosphoglycerate mutase [Rubripirellula reticaptiva]
MSRYFFCVLVIVSCFAPTFHASAKQPKVLTIGIDGLRSDAFIAAHTPNLDSLAANGMLSLATRVTSEAVPQSDTVSGPGWTTFLTGTWADRHGVTDNTFKGRDAKQAPHGFSLAKAIRPELRTASFLDWTPLQQFVTTDADINVVVTPNSKDKAASAWTIADQSLTLAAEPVLQHDDIDWVFVYLGSVDETGHGYGFHPSVPAYIAAIENVDRRVGKLVQSVTQRQTIANEDWLFLVSTDHGGEGTGHGGGRANPNVFNAPMIVSGDAAVHGNEVKRKKGEPVAATVDLVPLALTHLQVPIAARWQLAGRVDGWIKSTHP